MTEVFVESIFLEFVITFFYMVIEYFVPQKLLWNHRVVDGIEICERVWWYEYDLNIVYGICITILLCLVYFKVKKMVGSRG